MSMSQSQPRSLAKRTARVAAIATGTGAVACAACCVLPFAAPAVVLTGASGLLAWFDGGRAWLTAIAIGGVAGGWSWVAAQAWRARARPAKRTLYVMGIATAVLVVALAWRP